MNDKANFSREDLWSIDHKLQELALAIRVDVITDRIWKSLFSEEERQKISADDTMGPDIIDIWAKFKGVSKKRAVAELAREMDLLSDVEFDRILRSLGEETRSAEGASLPVWDNSVGELRFGDRVIKRVKRLKVAANVVRLLDAFQETGWSSRVDDPLPPVKELRQSQTQRLQETVKSLNRNLELIRFRTDGTGEGIVWERV